MKKWHHKWYLLPMLLLLLAGCSPMLSQSKPDMTKVSLPPQPIVKDIFSLLPLNEDGWFVVAVPRKDILFLVTKGSVINETRTIGVFVRPMPGNITDDDFFTFAKSIKKPVPASRFEVLKQESRKDNSTGKDCVQVHITAKDSAPQVPVKRPDPTMIIDSLYWVCKHPNGKKAIIVEYSNRFYPGGEEADFAKKAEAVFRGLSLR
jgi:hypothetical protein